MAMEALDFQVEISVAGEHGYAVTAGLPTVERRPPLRSRRWPRPSLTPGSAAFKSP